MSIAPQELCELPECLETMTELDGYKNASEEVQDTLDASLSDGQAVLDDLDARLRDVMWQNRAVATDVDPHEVSLTLAVRAYVDVLERVEDALRTLRG